MQSESITSEAFWTGLRIVWSVSADVPEAFCLVLAFYLCLLCLVLLGSPVRKGRWKGQGLALLLLRTCEQAVLSLLPDLVPGHCATGEMEQ